MNKLCNDAKMLPAKKRLFKKNFDAMLLSDKRMQFKFIHINNCRYHLSNHVHGDEIRLQNAEATWDTYSWDKQKYTSEDAWNDFNDNCMNASETRTWTSVQHKLGTHSIPCDSLYRDTQYDWGQGRNNNVKHSSEY